MEARQLINTMDVAVKLAKKQHRKKCENTAKQKQVETKHANIQIGEIVWNDWLCNMSEKIIHLSIKDFKERRTNGHHQSSTVP